MEKMPYQEHADADTVVSNVVSSVALVEPVAQEEDDWRTGLPMLSGSLVRLRELQASDAQSLFLSLTTEEVTRFISPPPATVEGFEKFIAWTHRQRVAGQYVCFAIVPRGSDTAVGLLQFRSLDSDFDTAEWGFAVDPEYWGTGTFGDAARIAIEFVFEVIGTHRLEARASLANGRGNAALRNLGAKREGTLRKSFLRFGEYHDQALWTLLAEEWYDAREIGCSALIH